MVTCFTSKGYCICAYVTAPIYGMRRLRLRESDALLKGSQRRKIRMIGTMIIDQAPTTHAMPKIFAPQFHTSFSRVLEQGEPPVLLGFVLL